MKFTIMTPLAYPPIMGDLNDLFDAMLSDVPATREERLAVTREIGAAVERKEVRLRSGGEEVLYWAEPPLLGIMGSALNLEAGRDNGYCIGVGVMDVAVRAMETRELSVLGQYLARGRISLM